MNTPVHLDLRTWLEASAAGRLSEPELDRLRMHLATCDVCAEAAASETMVAAVSSGLEHCHLDLDATIADIGDTVCANLPLSTPERRRALRRLRTWLRVGLAAAFIVLLVLRQRNIPAPRMPDGATGAVTAFCQLVLRTPRYDMPSLHESGLEPRQWDLAGLHQLTASCVSLLMWVAVLALAASLILDMARPHGILARSRAT